MKSLSRNTSEVKMKLKVIQFGEGNFLRAFIDWMIDILNKEIGYNGGVAVVQPLKHGLINVLKEQDGLYHHLRQGIEEEKTVDEIRKIECITSTVNPFEEYGAFFNLAEQPEVELIVSNTTEAGIEFKENDQPADNELAVTFPGKLTQLLKHRFDHFEGAVNKAVSVLPCELIESNGDKLRDCILNYIDLWDLSDEFRIWITEHTVFANTLVDRIVPGYPKDEIEEIKKRVGYDDKLVVKSEAFHLFVVQAPKSLQSIFPAEKAGLNVKFVDDITPYRTQKVRILNGTHTSMVQIGLLSGLETVAEAIDHEVLGDLMQSIMFEEIVPTIKIPGGDPKEFAKEIKGRFKNPFIRHELIDISLNSVSKYKVRVLPTVLDYLKIKGELPKRLVFALACLIKLYKERHNQLRDDVEFLQLFSESQDLSEEELVDEVLSKESMWDQDLSKVDGMRDLVLKYYTTINSTEMLKAIQNI